MRFFLNFSRLCAVILISGLAACGGSGGSNGGPAALGFDDLITETTRLSTNLDNAELTPVSDLPTGSAKYDGVFFVALDNGSVDGVLGTASIDVDFRTREFSGQAGNFVNLLEEPTTGSLSISNGSFIAADGGIGVADVRGSVDFEIGRRTINGDAISAFAGDEAALFTGFITGDAVSDNGDRTPIEAGWIAED